MSRLHVLRAGQGPRLLLLHGIGASATAWTKQIDRLGAHFTCFAPDLPGYGGSPDAESPGLDAIVAEVAGVLEEQPAHVLGVSFGALTALALARRRPELVKSLVLADATLGRAATPEDDRQRWLQLRQGLASDLATRGAERAREIAGPHASQEVIDEIAFHMRRARASGYMAVARAIAETDARPWLGAIRQPALLVCGEDDRVTGMNVSQTLGDHLPRARLVVVARAGHAPHIEQPERFAQAVREFLESVEAGDPPA